MFINAAIEELRKRLYKISTTSADQQHAAIIKLSKEFDHSISLIKLVTDNREGRANCHEYALGLQESEIVASIANSRHVIFLDEAFINSLLYSDLIEVDESGCRLNDLIIYFSGGLPTHSGLMKGNRIESKWGSGHIWQHKIDEIPINYGDEVRFFRKINKARALKAFCDYAIKRIDIASGKERIRLMMNLYKNEFVEKRAAP